MFTKLRKFILPFVLVTLFVIVGIRQTRVLAEQGNLDVLAGQTGTASPSPITTPQASPTVSPPASNTQPTPAAVKTAVPETRVSEKDRMEQVFVPAGEFSMGTNDRDAKLTIEGGRAYPEIPMHTVYLDDYWFDKYEVTNGQWKLCVADGACKEPNLMRSTTRTEYYPLAEFDNYPVLYVSWFMANDYCKWAGRRLPTEAEWEKAARGNDARRYPWGNEPINEERANFCDITCPKPHANPIFNDGYTDTAPVGSFPKGASAYGALDMAGNVWEWTSTIPAPYPYDAKDGREAEVGFERVWRGGTWTNGVWWQRASIRYRSVPTYWYGNLGFRCASTD
jgi:eukaryotic-like serine/threonine-protein kinase